MFTNQCGCSGLTSVNQTLCLLTSVVVLVSPDCNISNDGVSRVTRRTRLVYRY